MTPKVLPLGPVVLDVEGVRLTDADRRLLDAWARDTSK